MSDKKFGIAGILDEYTVIINAGLEDGIDNGDELRVLSKNATPLFDPFTKEFIANIHQTKATLIVTEAHNDYSYCQSNESINTDIINGYVNKTNRLRVHGSRIGSLSTLEPIQVGDLIQFI